jgi:hypothetical protein
MLLNGLTEGLDSNGWLDQWQSQQLLLSAMAMAHQAMDGLT